MRAPGGARLTRASPLLAQIKRCPRARPHDWTQCPFAHPVSARGGLPAARWCRPSRPRSLPARPSPPRAGREGQAERPPEVPVLGDGLPRLQKGARRRTRGRHHNRAMPAASLLAAQGRPLAPPAPLPPRAQTGACIRGDACPYAHGVFECWLHPGRYRTQLCTDGANCRRRVCFFAHFESEVRTPDELQAAPGAQAQLDLAAGARGGARR